MLLNDQPLNGLEIEEVLATLATFLIPYVAYYIRKFVTAHASAQRVDALRSLAGNVVWAAEELSHKAAKADVTVKGSDKLELASANLITLAKDVGLKLDEKQAKVLVEGELGALRPIIHGPQFDAVFEAEEEDEPVIMPEDVAEVASLREPDADGQSPV